FMKRKKIPYGISDFDRIRRQNYYYVDKTGFIGNIEDSPPYLFLIRPSRFGKSLFLSLMECYYDIKRKDDFEEIFSGTYIYDNPIEERNKYLILKFNFSAVRSNITEVEESFNNMIRLDALAFIEKYKDLIKDTDGEMYRTIKDVRQASEILKYVISFVKNKGKIYLLIDEYDNFTNTIISSQGKERYMAITHGEGFYRHFFNVIKWGTTGSDAPVSKLFITDEMNKQTALRDYIQGEKSVQTFLRAYLNISNYYITRSESELNKGYCDILMIPNLLSYPDLLYSYLLEIKYISVSEYSESRLNSKILEAEKELRRYEEDSGLKQFTGETKLIKIILVFCGVELKYKSLICE
ncbi:MAG: AAA family ATPase, partial [Candidatus Eremiobacterota bacterium]